MKHARKLDEVDRKLLSAPAPAAPPPDEDDEWLAAWCEENGSAVDVWGSPEVRAKLKELIAAGANVKTFMFNRDNGHMRSQALAKKRELERAGYRELAYEDNIDQAELILYRPKSPRTARRAVSGESRTRELINSLLSESDEAGDLPPETTQEGEPRSITLEASTVTWLYETMKQVYEASDDGESAEDRENALAVMEAIVKTDKVDDAAPPAA